MTMNCFDVRNLVRSAYDFSTGNICEVTSDETFEDGIDISDLGTDIIDGSCGISTNYDS